VSCGLSLLICHWFVRHADQESDPCSHATAVHCAVADSNPTADFFTEWSTDNRSDCSTVSFFHVLRRARCSDKKSHARSESVADRIAIEKPDEAAQFRAEYLPNHRSGCLLSRRFLT
jgi:hypothetical protein